MKHIRNILLLLAIEFLICYLCGAFVSATFSVEGMGESIRNGVVMGFSYAAMATCIAYGIINSKI